MKTLKELIKDPSTIIIDVRNPWEFEMEHIPGARNIPLEEISGNIDEFKSLTVPIVFYCRSGYRSSMAVSLLKQNGISEVINGGSIDEMRFNLN